MRGFSCLNISQYGPGEKEKIQIAEEMWKREIVFLQIYDSHWWRYVWDMQKGNATLYRFVFEEWKHSMLASTFFSDHYIFHHPCPLINKKHWKRSDDGWVQSGIGILAISEVGGQEATAPSASMLTRHWCVHCA